MSLLKSVIVYFLHLFFVVYLPEKVGIYLSSRFAWGLDGVTSTVFLFQLLGIVAIIYWMKHEKLLPVFKWKKWYWSYLLWFLAAFFLHRFVNHIYYYHSDWLHFVDSGAESMRPILRVLPTNVTVVMSFLTLVVTGPIFEEIFFRGYLMNVLFPKSKYYQDVVLSALLFAASHLILVERSLLGFALFTLMGLFFGFTYRFTRNLYLNIFCHSLVNFISWAGPLWIFLYNYIYYHFFR